MPGESRVWSFFVGTLLAGLVILASVSPVAAAEAPGPRLAFERSVGRTFDIWVMGLHGQGLTNLTRTPSTGEEDPAFSPDGSRLAFVRRSRIVLMDANGDNATQLTWGEPDEYDSDPTWSPDGEMIAFERADCGGECASEIFLIRSDGEGQHQVTFLYDSTDPAWAPDGSSIMFENANDIWTVTPDGEEYHNLTQGVSTAASQPAWSPDGALIAFRGCCIGIDLFTVRSDGTGLARLTRSWLEESHPKWSPDGRAIIFEARGDLILIGTEGRPELNLTADDEARYGHPTWHPSLV